MKQKYAHRHDSSPAICILKQRTIEELNYACRENNNQVAETETYIVSHQHQMKEALQ